MLKRLTGRELLEALASAWEPILRQAGIEAVDRICSNIVLRRMVERLKCGDIAGAGIDLGHHEPAAHPSGWNACDVVDVVRSLGLPIAQQA